MSKLRLGLVIALVSALAAFGAGCGDDDESSTPDTTSTPAQTTSTPTATTPTATTPTETTDDSGDVAAGQTFFEGSCQGCHTAGGTQAGAGPVLAGQGLTEEAITNQIVNGGGGMPPGLASGDDLENVTAFVLSIQ
jgi:mono/diheme cytochrome c family protein